MDDCECISPMSCEGRASTEPKVDAIEVEKKLQASLRCGNLAKLRLSMKEKELNELMQENESMRRNAEESRKADCMSMDHVVGTLFKAMRDEIRMTHKEAKLAALELKAVKNCGKESSEVLELAEFCKKLQAENYEMKSELSRIPRLETLLAYSRKTVERLRVRCRDFDDLLEERGDEIKRLRLGLARASEENGRLRRLNSISNHDVVEQKNDVETMSNEEIASSQATGEEADEGNTNAESSVIQALSVSSPESVLVELDASNRYDHVGLETELGEVISVSSSEAEHERMEAISVSSDEEHGSSEHSEESC